ncbi:MAG: Amino acid adenylation protein [uncultured bacterium]|nr:MAG: Amino acid adenylation protein [uncultured bacterium]
MAWETAHGQLECYSLLINEKRQTETDRPFDLTEGPALRWRLYNSCRTEYVLLLSIHHIITDYGSIVMMMEELSAMFAEGRIIATGAGTDGSPTNHREYGTQCTAHHGTSAKIRNR